MKYVKGNRHSVAIVSHFFPAYREPVLLGLQNQGDEAPKYELASDVVGNQPNMKLIDPAKYGLGREQGGLNWRRLRNVWMSAGFYWQNGVMSLALSRDFDTIIYTGMIRCLSTWISASLARLTGKRVLMWSHGPLKMKPGLTRLLRGVFYRIPHGLCLYSHGARLNCAQMGISDEQVYVVFNSLDYESQVKTRRTINDTELNRLRESLFSDPSLPILMYVGRMIAAKRLDLLIEAGRRLGENGKPVNLLLIGDGPEKSRLIMAAQTAGIADRACFYGACHDESKLGPLISVADLCAVPGDIGLTCIHAFAYGTPCITHDNAEKQGPEHEAIVPGKTGLLYRYGNSDDFYEKLVQWLETKTDRSQVKADCQEMVDRYYNPEFQRIVFNASVESVSASNLSMGTESFTHVHQTAGNEQRRESCK